jgi:HK97 family phage major capsid protein
MPRDNNLPDSLESTINELNQTFDDFREKNDQRLKEVEQFGKAKGELETQVTKMSGRIGELEKHAEKLADVEKALARRQSQGDGTGADLQKQADEFMQIACKRRGIPVEALSVDEYQAYRKSFNQWMRKGDTISADHQKALSVGTDPDGGYLVDPDTSGRIVQKVFETSPMRSFASVQTIGTDSLEGLLDNDELMSGWVNETETREETDTPQLGKWSIPVHELYAQPAATQKMLDDSSINIEAWLSNKVADSFSRKENAAFVNGDGSGKPRGFLTYPDGTKLTGQIERVKTGVSGGFATDGTGADALINFVYKLKQAYRARGNFFMARQTMADVRKLKSADGQYLWQPGIAGSQPSRLMGYGIGEFDDMPVPADGSLSIAFGDMRSAYQVVDRAGIRVLRDPYTKKPYVMYYTTKRVGGDVVNFEALKLLQFSA